MYIQLVAFRNNNSVSLYTLAKRTRIIGIFDMTSVYCAGKSKDGAWFWK